MQINSKNIAQNRSTDRVSIKGNYMHAKPGPNSGLKKQKVAHSYKSEKSDVRDKYLKISQQTVSNKDKNSEDQAQKQYSMSFQEWNVHFMKGEFITICIRK